MSEATNVLFEITDKHLNTGLRGFPVGTVRTSKVGKMEGVSYVGYPIGDLAYLDPEAVVFLLLNKQLPTDAELAAFKADLASRSVVPQDTLARIAALPKDLHPMEWLMTGLLFIGMNNKTGSYKEDALNVMARMPTLVATVFRARSGWGELIPSKPELGLVENFVHQMGIPGGDNEKLSKLLRTFYILHMDHGGGNLSTFSGKAVASGLADIYASLTAAMAGLYGPRHGRANQDCLNFVRSVGTTDPDAIEAMVRERLANKQLIFGFGHAVLRAEDPRATIQYELGKKICGDDPLFQTALALRERAVKVLKENPKVSNPYPNVDAVSGTLLNASGLTDSDYYTLLFGLARCSGIAAQIVDEREVFRGGKGVAIYRCSFKAENQDPKRLG